MPLWAQLFPIELLQPYSQDYNDCISEAQADQRRDARPELVCYPDSLDGYDTIYLGYLNYWGTMPMCVFTFLEHFDFTGKTIRPFCTHEGSGMGGYPAPVPRGRGEKGTALARRQRTDGGPKIEKWLRAKD